jgi:hypothetical protein
LMFSLGKTITFNFSAFLLVYSKILYIYFLVKKSNLVSIRANLSNISVLVLLCLNKSFSILSKRLLVVK